VLPDVGVCSCLELVSALLGSCWGSWPGFALCLALPSCELSFVLRGLNLCGRFLARPSFLFAHTYYDLWICINSYVLFVHQEMQPITVHIVRSHAVISAIHPFTWDS
jgi:hypothetical protein